MPRNPLAPLLRKRRIAQAYRALFQSPEGELVLHDLLRRAGVMAVSDTLDPAQVTFDEGRRSLALEILAELRWTEGDFARLAAERAQPEPYFNEEAA